MPLILGIDPGSLKTGYALLAQHGRKLDVVKSGTIRLKASLDLALRLGRLADEIDAILDADRPDSVAVEDIFFHRNARSALALGQARGVILAAAGRRDLPVAAYPPATVKQAVCGHGRADKGQIQRMTQVMLSLDGLPQEDEADAMAVAICHALRQRGEALRQAQGKMKRNRETGS